MAAWWTAAAVAALSAGDEAAAIERDEDPDLHGLVMLRVDSWALLLRTSTHGVVPAEQRQLLAAAVDAMTLRWVDDELTNAALDLVDSYRIPARVAWELAGALAAGVDRVVTPDRPLLIAASMLGFRAYSTGEL